MWKDQWIPRNSCWQPFTPDLYELGNISVSNFILADGRGWNIEALNWIFWEEDIAEILRIPLGYLQASDVRRWFFM